MVFIPKALTAAAIEQGTSHTWNQGFYRENKARPERQVNHC